MRIVQQGILRQRFAVRDGQRLGERLAVRQVEAARSDRARVIPDV